MNSEDEKELLNFELDEIDLAQFAPPVPAPELSETPPMESEVSAETAMDSETPALALETAPSPGKGKMVWLAVAGGIMGALLLFFFLMDGFGVLGNRNYPKQAPVVSLNNEILTSSDEFRNSLEKLEGLSKFINKPAKIRRALEQVGLSEKLFVAGNRATDRFLEYVQRNRGGLENRGMGIFNEIGNYYRSKAYKRYRSATEQYLGSFSTVLRYRQKHHQSILDGIQPYRETHDLYYNRYRQSLKHYQYADSIYRKYLDHKIKKNKGLAGLLANGNATLKNLGFAWWRM